MLSNEDALLQAMRAVLPKNALVVFHGRQQRTLNELRTLWSRARVVVGAHGAGLSNLIYAAPGTALVEIAHPEPGLRFYMLMAAALDLPYWAVTDVAPARYEHSVTINPERLAALVRAAYDDPSNVTHQH